LLPQRGAGQRYGNDQSQNYPERRFKLFHGNCPFDWVPKTSMGVLSYRLLGGMFEWFLRVIVCNIRGDSTTSGALDGDRVGSLVAMSLD